MLREISNFSDIKRKMAKTKKDKFDKHACEFKNEDKCEEELEEEGESLEEVDKEHYDKQEECEEGVHDEEI